MKISLKELDYLNSIDSFDYKDPFYDERAMYILKLGEKYNFEPRNCMINSQTGEIVEIKKNFKFLTRKF